MPVACIGLHCRRSFASPRTESWSSSEGVAPKTSLLLLESFLHMRLSVAVFTAALLSAPALFGVQIYQTIDPAGSLATRAWAVNNSGLVAGEYSTAAGTFGFIYNPAT